MIYTQMTNANLGKVGEGMMKVAEAMDIHALQLNAGEKVAVITGLFEALVCPGSPLWGKSLASDLLDVATSMRREAKITKRPEYGAAVQYIQKEILVS